MSKDIDNKNSKGQLHGYQETYWNGKLGVKCFYNNGIPIDYEEYYYLSGELEKIFHI